MHIFSDLEAGNKVDKGKRKTTSDSPDVGKLLLLSPCFFLTCKSQIIRQLLPSHPSFVPLFTPLLSPPCPSHCRYLTPFFFPHMVSSHMTLPLIGDVATQNPSNVRHVVFHFPNHWCQHLCMAATCHYWSPVNMCTFTRLARNSTGSNPLLMCVCIFSFPVNPLGKSIHTEHNTEVWSHLINQAEILGFCSCTPISFVTTCIDLSAHEADTRTDAFGMSAHVL